MEKYTYKGIHKQFKVKGELHHFISDELFCSELLSSYYEGLGDGENKKITKINDGIIHDLNLLIKNIRELIEQQKLKDDGFLQHCIKSIEWQIKRLTPPTEQTGGNNGD